MKVVVSKRPARVLDFDIETIAAGFADPNWVPQKISCVAWSFVGEESVHSRICGPLGLYSRPQNRRKMLEPLLAAIDEADLLIGHNIIRFDLPVLNAECLRLGLPSLKAKRVQDTMRIVKTKGFKKGQDNIIQLTGVPLKKLALSWQEWQDAYEENGWKTIIERCEGDVMGHKMMWAEMKERGWLKPETVWKP